MEKLKTLLLILAGLVFFVWRMIQKMRETTRQEQRERPPAQPAAALPNTSFEELLRQMQQQNDRGNTAAAKPTPRPTTPGGRPLPREQAAKARTQERPAARPVSQERRVTNVSLERAAPVARRGTGIQHDKPSSPPKLPTPTADASRRAALNARLRSPAELREAFILSEILRRKFD